ncbi:hypothetical protein JST97_02975 [bacterium]|nr:hypothetical protein [bacterium]
MISLLMSSSSPLALARATRSRLSQPAESQVYFHDHFVPSQHHHEPDPPRPFNLLEHISKAPTKCYYCNGSGKCQQDYPGPGSGKDWKGEAEYRCSGSGKCQQCGGTGWLSARYKVTMH